MMRSQSVTPAGELARAPISWMARRLNGDLGKEVTDDTLFPRSPTTDRRYDPAWRRDDPPSRRAVPGQFLLRHPAVAALSQHRLGRAPPPRRREPARAHARGPPPAWRTHPPAPRGPARGGPG